MAALMADSRASDLTVVIPTRDRWPILHRTLDALARQTVTGFRVIVVVDGFDQQIPGLGAAEVIVKQTAGSAAARNAGVAAVRTPLTMLIDDDMIPTPETIEHHLRVHELEPADSVAVLGRVTWHPDLPSTRISRWLDWSRVMFDYEALAGLGGTDVGWGRFYTCNVSFKTALFRRVGGLDERFMHYYEDTDFAKRLGEAGLKLIYEPRAHTQHLQRFDWPSVQHRFNRVAIGERIMVHKHPDFKAWYVPQMQAALAGRPPLAMWTVIADRTPRSVRRLRQAAEHRANRVYMRRLAESYLAFFQRADAICELMDYLGDRYEPLRLMHSVTEVEWEEEAAPDEATFYRTSHMYLYDLTAFAVTGTKRPYLSDLRRFLPPGASLLDYGCGIGSDGLRLLDEGYRVAFADFANPSTEYLRWRLARRDADAPVYDLDADDIPAGFDAAYSFDVIEHVEDPFGFLDELERRASIVAVNFLAPDPNDTHLHKPLPIPSLLDHAAALGILHYRRYYGRSHLVIYRTRRPALRGRARSQLQRHLGPRLRPTI
jgi:GT2 family glycosyltransferase/2-polyprenyl-3-methyl-5-hydroxy-6-metoxy-1,4-benzoquinol methylase